MAQSSNTTNGTAFDALNGYYVDGEAVLQLAEVDVTSANILAMNGAPVTVIAAPGAGKAIVVENVLAKVVTTATQYANGGAVGLYYHGGAVCTSTMAASIVNAAAGTSYYEMQGAGAVALANVGIDISNATAAFITGTGTMKLYIKYRIVEL